MAEPLFSLYRGDDYGFAVAIKDSAGNPVDITGWAFKSTMKLNFMDPDEKATVQVNVDPLSGSEAEQGRFVLVLPADQTKNLLPAMYFFDLQREYNGVITTVIRGQVRVYADITKRVG